MKNNAVLGSLYGVVAFCLIASVEAANKPKVMSSSVDPVQELLQNEPQATTDSVDRREILKPSIRPETVPETSWWQSGYTRIGKQWLAFEKSVSTGADAALLDEYQEHRDELSKQSHGQLKLATWCRKKGLHDQERVHLLRVLTERDPSASTDSIYERLGCQKVGNYWVSPQERKEAEKIQVEIEQSHKRWDSKLATLTQLLDGTTKQRTAAEKQLAEIADPSAIPAIISTLCMSNPQLAERGVRMLGEIQGYQASRALAGQAVFSPWKPVRTKAIESLKQRKLPEYVPDLLLLLSNPVHVKVNVEFKTRPASTALALGPDFAINLDYVWVEETRDTIQVGIRRLFPISIPSKNVEIVSAMHPDLRTNGTWRLIGLHELQEQKDILDYSVDEMNDSRLEMNNRVGHVLCNCADQPMSSEPKVWWDWWTNFQSVDPLSQKNVVVVDERQNQPNAPSFSSTTIQKSCLVAGTPIWTERGFVPIEQIQPGDRVLSKEIDSGELAYKPVLQTTIRQPTAVHKIRVADDEIVASLGHHFWVSGEGWAKTRELLATRPLHTATGMQRVTSVEDEGRIEEVYNLVIADFHTYFVGKSMVLSHDVTTPSLTNVKVPGLAPK